jgi:hypothetical protein
MKSKRISGFGGSDEDDNFQFTEVKNKNKDLIDIVYSTPEDELLVIQDIIKEKLESDNDKRLAKMPNLATPEFNVFDNRKIEKVTNKVIEIRRRRYMAFVYYYSHYDRTDDQMVQFIQMCNPGLSYIEAIRDLSNIKLVIGNQGKARKELIRYQVTEMHKKAFQKALENDNEIGMTMAAKNMGVANALDKDDIDIPWEEMIPPALEPTSDIAAVGGKPIKDLDAKIVKLKAKYLDDVQEAEEV